MADRSLRGMRLGHQSLQSEEGVAFMPRSRAIYRTDDGEEFVMIFAADAEMPPTWTSPQTGQPGRLLDESGVPVEAEEADVKSPRTPWEMLLERRSVEELEEILNERLEYLRSRRGSGRGNEKIGA